MKTFFTTLGLLGFGFVVFFVFYVLITGMAERQAWLDAHCEVVGKISGSTSVGVGIGSNGNTSVIPISTPSKTQYKCDDGITYTE